MPDRKKSGFALAARVLTLIVVVAGLAAGVIGLQSSKLLGSKASSGCTIVQTDQGPGCWCSNGGWQFHCGVPKGEPAPDQCISDCQDRNTDNPDDNTPKADKCDKGKVGGPCSGQYQYACGGDGCKAECNNYPKHGRWVLTGDKNCGKPGDIKPKPTGAPTPTPTPKSRPQVDWSKCHVRNLQLSVDNPIKCNSGGGLTIYPPFASLKYFGNCSNYHFWTSIWNHTGPFDSRPKSEIQLKNVGGRITTAVVGAPFHESRSSACTRENVVFNARVSDEINSSVPGGNENVKFTFTDGGESDCFKKGRFCNGY